MTESQCHEDSPECWCPCGCGCQNDPQGGCLPFSAIGLCASCAEGNHEVPPFFGKGLTPPQIHAANIEELIAAHESILAQLRVLRNGYVQQGDGFRFMIHDGRRYVSPDFPEVGTPVEVLLVEHDGRVNFTWYTDVFDVMGHAVVQADPK